MTRILLVDDEPQILRALQTTLEAHGFDVSTTGLGEDASVRAADADLVLLDLGLPDIDGSQVIHRVRAFSDVPIIVLSVRGAQGEKIRALDAGADDYVTKPFSMQELLARTRAALRRAQGDTSTQPVRRFGALEVDLARRLVTRASSSLRLAPKEYGLLEAFVSNPGTLLSHRWLLRRVWGLGYEGEVDSLRHAVRSLRRKLGDTAAAPAMITTEPGLGYRWIAEPSA